MDEQRELQINVGKAMDVLRKDYPYFLKRAPGEYCDGYEYETPCVFTFSL